MEEQLRKYILEYLDTGKTKMIQVATTVNDQPWICTMYYAYDDDLNIYWASKESRRHSQEMAANNQVAAAIAYDQQPPSETHQGLQISGTVQMLEGNEFMAGLDLYALQLGSDPEWIGKIKSGEDAHRIYKLTPKTIVLFDDINFPENSRQEINL